MAERLDHISIKAFRKRLYQNQICHFRKHTVPGPFLQVNGRW